MYYAKKILIKSAISLFAGVASAIGMQVGTAIWNGVYERKPCKR